MIKLLSLTLLLIIGASGQISSQQIVRPLAMHITNTSPLPSAVINKAYNVQLNATGGRMPYTWSIASGSLPPGMVLTASGVIQGTPTATGTFTVKVKVQ